MTLFLKKILTFFMAVLAFFGILKPEITTTLESGSVEILGIRTTVSLDANATTGYAWSCAVDGDAVKLTEDRYVTAPAKGMVGVGGTQIYVFEAVKPGLVTITFTYGRAWEKGPIRTETLVLQVADDLTVTIPV